MSITNLQNIMEQKIKGFTLVELIVVITILAVLATIWFISLTWYSNEAKSTTNIANLKSIDNALGIYRIKNEVFPDPDNSVNITSSWTIVAKQWIAGSRFLGIISVSQDTVDTITNQPYIYTKSVKTNKYWFVGYSNDITLLNNQVSANSNTIIYKWNWAPVVLNEDNQNINSDLDILNIPEEYTIAFDNQNYGSNSDKLLKYYYHPNAISIVNFNDGGLWDLLWNKVNFKGKLNITEWRVWNGILISWSGWWLEVDISNHTIWEELTLSAWINQSNYTTMDWVSRCWSNGMIIRHSWKWAYMVSDHEWYICWYRYKFSPAWYHNSWYQTPLNQWTHIVQVWDGIDLKFYINWELQYTVATQADVDDLSELNDIGWKYYIWREALDQVRRYFDWVIDEVSMYNTALTAQEVSELYSLAP